jgi:P27 family predicted phage terminase small subunit
MPARKGSGRKPLPTNLKVLMGNPGKQKLPQNEPTPPPSDLPEPPVHLDAYGKEEWNRIAEGLYNMGVLTGIDQQSLAAYCAAYSRWRTAEEQIQERVKKGGVLAGLIDKTSNGNIIQNCLIGIANKAAGDMIRYASEFGLTPAARARLSISPGDKDKSKFRGLIGAGSGSR